MKQQKIEIMPVSISSSASFIKKGTQLQELNILIGFIILFVKGSSVEVRAAL
jgi:hypothetical protein